MKQNFLKGAIIISVGGIAAKILGAFYRIPLTNILGGEGMGVYQMVYPLYCLLLTVSATGIPSGLARIVSSAESRGDHAKSRAVLFKSLLLFSGVGLCGSALMFLLAPAMSAAQGETAPSPPIAPWRRGVFRVRALLPARLVSGQEQLFPTAFSEICEQAVKVALGLFFARAFRGEPFAVAWTLASVTFSEFAACLLLAFLAWGERTNVRFSRTCAGSACKTAARVTIPSPLRRDFCPFPTSGQHSHRAAGRKIRLQRHRSVRAVRGGGGNAGQSARFRVLRHRRGHHSRRVRLSVQGTAGKRRSARSLPSNAPSFSPCPRRRFCWPSRGVTSFLFSSVTGRKETLASLVRALALTAVFSPACRRSPPA